MTMQPPFAPSSDLDRRTLLGGIGAVPLAAILRPGTAMAAPAKLDLSALESRAGGRIGLCAIDGGNRVAWRPSERFAFCSTFKLFLAAATLERVQRGEERLDRQIPIKTADMVPHAPVTKPAVGGTLPIEALCKATVEISDNPAANILVREMGGLDAWRDWYRSIGDQVTRVDRYEVALNSADPNDHRDTTTPEQYAANLRAVLLGGRLSPGHLALLERWIVDTPTGAGRIKAGVPAGYRVGHKTGTGARGTHNDIGIVWPPAGRPILLAVFLTGAVTAKPEARDAAMAEATRMAMAALDRA